MIPSGRSINIRISSMLGMGDNVYCSAAVALWLASNPESRISIQTPWPQFYPQDERVSFRKRDSRIACAQKNADAQKWSNKEASTKYAECGELRYAPAKMRTEPIWRQLATIVSNYPTQAPINQDDFWMRFYGERSRPWFPDKNEPYALIRPAVKRTEWDCESRNCEQAYIQTACNRAKVAGFKTVMVSNHVPGLEEYVDFRPECDVMLENCTTTEELLELTRKAAFVVSPVGFMAPFCTAIGTPCLLIHGGLGGFNSPEIINAPGIGSLIHMLPKNYCRECTNKAHACDKSIEESEFSMRFEAVLNDYEERK